MNTTTQPNPNGIELGDVVTFDNGHQDGRGEVQGFTDAYQRVAYVLREDDSEIVEVGTDHVEKAEAER